MNIELSSLSIRGNIEDALSSDLSKTAQGCRVLGFMGSQGRADSVVFLLGLLRYYRSDLKRLEPVVDALGGCFLPAVADALFDEILRIKGSNQTRTYLNLVIQVLSRFPKDLAADRFLALSEDSSHSPKMRAKFRRVAEDFFPWLRDDADW